MKPVDFVWGKCMRTRRGEILKYYPPSLKPKISQIKRDKLELSPMEAVYICAYQMEKEKYENI